MVDRHRVRCATLHIRGAVSDGVDSAEANLALARCVVDIIGGSCEDGLGCSETLKSQHAAHSRGHV